MFTVLIPVYNTHPANLITAFFSVYEQKGVTGYPVLIVNDGSDNPDTLRALKFIEQHERVTIMHHEKRKGSAAARNTGLHAITTEYVMLMDSDDIASPGKFKVQVDYMKKHKPHILGTNLYSFYNDDFDMQRVFKTKHLEVPEYNNGWLVNQGTVLLSRKAVLDIGGYNEALLRAQDIDLWKRMYKAGYSFRNITGINYAWRRYRK